MLAATQAEVVGIMNTVAFVEIGQSKPFSGDRKSAATTETSAMFSAVLEMIPSDNGTDRIDLHPAAKMISDEVAPPDQAVETAAPVFVATSPERVGKPFVKPPIRPVCTLGPMGILDIGDSEAAVVGTPAGKFSIGRDKKTDSPPNSLQGLLPAAELIQLHTSSAKNPVEGGTAMGSATPDAGISPTDFGTKPANTSPAIQTSAAPIAFDRTSSDMTALPIESSPSAVATSTHDALTVPPSSAAPATPETSGARENDRMAMPPPTVGFSTDPEISESDSLRPITPKPQAPINSGDDAAARQFGVRNGQVEARQIPQFATPHESPEIEKKVAYSATEPKPAADGRGLVADRTALAHAFPDRGHDAGPSVQTTSRMTENLTKDNLSGVDLDVDPVQSVPQSPQKHYSDQSGSGSAGHIGKEPQPIQVRSNQAQTAPASVIKPANEASGANSMGSDPSVQVTLPVNDNPEQMVTMPSLQGLGGHPTAHISPGPIRVSSPTLALPDDLGRVLAHAASHFTDRPVEVTLSPDELGRVRMTLATHDGNLNMAIQADRPETLDLLRRHIDSLAQDFRDMGFDDLNFSFAHDQEQRPQRPAIAAESGEAANQTPGLDQPIESSLTSTTRAANAGLDLRM